jgi:hypothetical protein
MTLNDKAKLTLNRLKKDGFDCEILQINEDLNAVAIKINGHFDKNKAIESVDSNPYTDFPKNKINGPCVLAFFKEN